MTIEVDLFMVVMITGLLCFAAGVAVGFILWKYVGKN